LVGDELKNIKISHIDQTNESNMHFITRIASQYDAVGKPIGGMLAVEKHGQAKSRTGKSPQDINVTIDMCTRWSANIKDQPRYSKVKARYYDKKTASYIEKESSGGTSDGPTQTLKKTYPTEEEAQSAADSAMSNLNRTTGDVSLTLVGDPRLRAEYYVQLQGFHPLIDKRWLIKTATHSISSSGYTTELSCESETKTGDQPKATSKPGAPAQGKPPTSPTMTVEEMQQQIEANRQKKQ
jgi:phage protein D